MSMLPIVLYFGKTHTFPIIKYETLQKSNDDMTDIE